MQYLISAPGIAQYTTDTIETELNAMAAGVPVDICMMDHWPAKADLLHTIGGGAWIVRTWGAPEWH